jgi:hypothetical protein
VGASLRFASCSTAPGELLLLFSDSWLIPARHPIE